jgi:23S rRNA G2069 N7-methylase RlmK/C1962 C5-methylase RlmI
VTATARQAEMLANRVRKNARHLRKWARRQGVTCYRVYDRDIPEVPLAIDIYDGRLHIAEYRRGDERDQSWLDQMASEVAAVLEVDAAAVYLKRRERQRGTSQYERQGDAGARFTVEEGGHRFWVNLSDYLDTGLFLDHRITRGRVAAEAAGKRFLNLFCYTASFSVYAAAAGAAETVSVDMSNTYLDWAADNFELNQLSLERNRLIHADVMAALSESKGGYELAVVDPPTFSNSKRMERTFDVNRDHVELLRGVARLMVPGGVVYFSTNSRKFRLDSEALPDMDIDDISAATIPEDFRDSKIHRCYRIVVR